MDMTPCLKTKKNTRTHAQQGHTTTTTTAATKRKKKKIKDKSVNSSMLHFMVAFSRTSLQGKMCDIIVS